MVEEGWVHYFVSDQALHFAERQLVDVLRVVADRRAAVTKPSQCRVLDHLETKGEGAENGWPITRLARALTIFCAAVVMSGLLSVAEVERHRWR